MKKIIAILGVLIVVAAIAAGGWWWMRQRHIAEFAAKPFGPSLPTTVEIPSGTGPHALGTLLAKAGLVSSADDFYAYVRAKQAGPKLKHGEYEFAGPLTPEQILDKIVAGQVKTYHFTVPEGLRVDEILDIISSSELQLNRKKLAALVTDKAFLKKAGVPAESAEGFLYPDTYTFARPFSEELVLNKMLARTLEEYRKADAHRKPGVKLDELGAITLASIIEKETAAADERPRISCLFHNRLRLKMKLQTDPTVLYAKMLRLGHYENNITKADLTADHPYNTYTRFGLPPGPIASPGAAAIQAALEPLDCHDLYFVSRNNGTHEFCPDLKCHNAAVKHWQVDFFRDQKKQQKASSKDKQLKTLARKH